MTTRDKLGEAKEILAALGFPRAQLNDRSGLCLLALTDIGPDDKWTDAQSPLIGITPIMEFAARKYGKKYAPNTRETVRRQSMHQFVDAGLAVYNPDDPSRAVNSPKAVYRISSEALSLVRSFGSKSWKRKLQSYLANRETLAARYAKARDQRLVPVRITAGTKIQLSHGEHSELIKKIIEDFGPRHVPGGALVYVGDTGSKMGYFSKKLLASLGVEIDNHGKMPDVVMYDKKRNWLLLVESVTSHGPVDGKRHAELMKLFKNATAGLVYVTAFPNRPTMARYLGEIAWETEVWVADAPSHLIHFNGDRFLGPYNN